MYCQRPFNHNGAGLSRWKMRAVVYQLASWPSRVRTPEGAAMQEELEAEFRFRQPLNGFVLLRNDLRLPCHG
jgi:hypothetical protein